MNYTKIKPYGPTLDTEWGRYTTPYIMYDPNEYLFRQPAAPLALNRTRHPVIEPPAIHSALAPFQHGYQRGTGLAGEFDAEKIESTAPTIKDWLIVGGIFGLLYLLCKYMPGVRSNPFILTDGALPGTAPAPVRRSRRYSRKTRTKLRKLGKRASRKQPRDPNTGKFIPR